MLKRKKKSLTLIEIMVVIALIGIIGGVVGVNMKKSMDKAKDFKSQTHKRKIEDALDMYYAENSVSPDQVKNDCITILTKSGLFKDVNHLMQDAWGRPLEIEFIDQGFVCRVIGEPKSEADEKKISDAP